MPSSTPLPRLWLLSDERNDDRLNAILNRRSPRIAFVYRHYHLPPGMRRLRFEALQCIARMRGHLVILADNAATARAWAADGIYAAANRLPANNSGLLRIATAHDMAEIAQANRAAADAVMLSPVFATRSHPDGRVLGVPRFLALARHAHMPVIALGGLNAAGARRLKCRRWAAIDGLSDPHFSARA